MRTESTHALFAASSALLALSGCAPAAETPVAESTDATQSEASSESETGDPEPDPNEPAMVEIPAGEFERG